MRNIVLWSGGCDSTLLLYQLSKSNPDKSVHAVSICTSYAPDAIEIKREKVCREKIKKHFNEMGINNILYTEINVDMPLNEEFESWTSLMFFPIIYLGNITPYLKHGDIVYQAYIKEDIELHFKYPILNLAKLVSAIIGVNFEYKFPFEYKSKIDVVDEIIKLGLLDKVSWCSHPLKDGSPCKKCRSCIMHYSALYGLKLKKGEIDESTL